MWRAIEHIPVGQTSAAELRGTVTLAFADRHRRRFRLMDDAGEPFLLDLPHAVRLGDGDFLRLADGGVIVVRAADEPVMTITCAGPVASARMAWHIGNRHTPMQVLKDGRLRIVHDHVLREMIIGLGGVVDAEIAPFDPERGAYHGLGGNAHEHGHHHGHDHDFFANADDDGASSSVAVKQALHGSAHGHSHGHSHDHDHHHDHSHDHARPHSHSHPHGSAAGGEHEH
ncbi:urease accessory protein UreE [Thalassospira marina]|uniref:Urease accessory protein UreE n=1 Tax=Thalassospira marina TaxID=2048283 RepID=A0ABN5FGM1_9PROT|nr:urease accessory protein UreE [Thalassospira marina]AUG54298.1 siroheme synthase [Thalassospira marina]